MERMTRTERIYRRMLQRASDRYRKPRPAFDASGYRLLFGLGSMHRTIEARRARVLRRLIPTSRWNGGRYHSGGVYASPVVYVLRERSWPWN